MPEMYPERISHFKVIVSYKDRNTVIPGLWERTGRVEWIVGVMRTNDWLVLRAYKGVSEQ